jgi:ribosomal protein S18 acetylase RimI-like enzyme/DNA-binding transcriptional ArsR family regulator
VQIREFEPGDAAAVARMWRASDSAWPGGFDDGLLISEEDLLRGLRERNVISTYIAWEDGKAAGFADVYPVPEEERVGYLGLLNSDPEFHGRGVGRDLIRRCIDRCIELGYKRLDLHTWQGNTRAVPLYKKTGFGWGPENEKLQNHMPLLLSHPLTKGFFERVDWYKGARRNLSLGYDTERRDGALVFPYVWEGEAGTLRAVFDQKAKALVELETPELSLSLETSAFEVLRGQELTARLPTTHQNVSKHLAVLYQAGIVGRRRDGPCMRYALVDWTGWWLVEQMAQAVAAHLEELHALFGPGAPAGRRFRGVDYLAQAEAVRPLPRVRSQPAILDIL